MDSEDTGDDGSARTTVVAGVGETLGTALARRFGAAGDRVALLARSPDRIEDLAAELRDEGGEAIAVTADVTDPDAVSEAFDAVRSAFGRPEVLVHNASAPAAGPVDRADPDAFETPWRVRTYGGYLLVREFLDGIPETADEPTGTVLFSGTSFATDPAGEMPGWDSAAAATRGLARSLARELEPRGVHVAYVAIGGGIAPPGGYVTEDRMPADAVAEEFYRLVEQDESTWSREVGIGPRDRV